MFNLPTRPRITRKVQRTLQIWTSQIQPEEETSRVATSGQRSILGKREEQGVDGEQLVEEEVVFLLGLQ